MKKTLLDVIFASDKRKKVLLLLQDGPQEMETLLELLDTRRQSLLPQIRVLEDHHLISQLNDSYELTTIGKVIVRKMYPLIATIDLFDRNIDYWGTRNLDKIPPGLLKTIEKIGKCDVISPSLTELYNVPQAIYSVTQESSLTIDKFTEASIKSKYYAAVTTFLYPNTDQIIAEMLDKQVSVNFIIAENLMDKILAEFRTPFIELLKNPLFHFYVSSKKTGFLSFAYTNSCFLMRLLNEKGEYDSKYILCSDSDALQWAKELFEYYQEDTTPVTEL